MSRRSAIKPLQEISEINMTPLIDLTFLLLITFIITMPLVEQGIPVNLPKGRSKDIDQQKSRSITLNLQGQLYLDQAPVTLAQLADEMKRAAQDDPETTVMVRADDKLAYGKIVEVMRVLQDAQITRMALVTTPEQTAAR